MRCVTWSTRTQSTPSRLSPDGARLATAGKDGVVTVWNTADGKQVYRTTGGHQGAVTDIAWSPNGQMLVSSGADGSVYLWNAGDGKRTGTVSASGARVTATRLSPEQPARS